MATRAHADEPMTAERLAAVRAMLDHPAYAFTYGGTMHGSLLSAQYEVGANSIVAELLAEIDRLNTGYTLATVGDVALEPDDRGMVPLARFAEHHGLELRVTHYVEQGRYAASFRGAEVKKGGLLASEYGSGATADAAIADYARIISGVVLVFDAYSENRREIRVPHLSVAADTITERTESLR